MTYQELNARTIDRWVEEGWEWGVPVSHETFENAKNGVWDVVLTPTVPVPHDWFGDLRGKKVLGLASGGGQQIPIFAALGAEVTVLDLSDKQLESERLVAEREGYDVEIVKADMTKPLPFPDEAFDLIFHPVSDCYVEKVEPIFREAYRVLKKGGAFLGGYDNGVNFLVNDDETAIVNTMPFDPLKNEDQRRQLEEDDCGMQFSHSLGELIGGQLRAGFTVRDIYDDVNGSGRLNELNVNTFFAVRATKD
ncbi:MAG: class I SAM-dependent methyltransferase [Clostridia bacterium]|nr:class I SAM-dependent methyltransferase [Clostridia bacterium]